MRRWIYRLTSERRPAIVDLDLDQARVVNPHAMLSGRIAFVLLICAASAFGRIGETPDQFAQRYGAPTDTRASQIKLLEGALHHAYEYQGWKIEAAFIQPDGPAVRMEYSKTAKTSNSLYVQDYELQAIMTANTPAGTTWKEIPYNNPDLPSGVLNKLSQAWFGSMLGEKMWQRNDGAILWRRSKLIVRVELPIARQYEAQVKAEKEQKARSSVPQF